MERFRYFWECSGRLLLVEVDMLNDSLFPVRDLERDQYSERWVIKCCVNLGVNLGSIGVTVGDAFLELLGQSKSMVWHRRCGDNRALL